MNKTRQFTGKSLDDAKREASEQLRIPVRDLVIEKVDHEGGFIFGKKVVITVRDMDQGGGGDEVNFLSGLLRAIRVEAEINREEHDERIVLQVSSTDGGLLIGKNGQVLEALQYLVSKAARKKQWSEKPILVDVEGYRQRRLDKLRDRVLDMAERAKDRGRPMTTEPLNSYERRAVHLALQEITGITCRSMGEGQHRRIRIYPGSASQRDTHVDNGNASSSMA